MRLLPRDFGEASWHRKLWKCSQSIESWKGALESKPLMHWKAGFCMSDRQCSTRKTDNCSLGHHHTPPPIPTPPCTRGMGLPFQQESVFVLSAGSCGLAFVFTREESSLCPPAAVKTLLENQTEVSTQELTLEKTRPNKQTFLNERPSGLRHRPLG